MKMLDTSQKKWTLEEVAAKVEWEGGIVQAMRWGLTSEDIEDVNLAAVWKAAEAVLPYLDNIEDILSSVDVDEEV